MTGPGAQSAEATRVLSGFLRDVMAANTAYRNFRLFGPDETESNRLGAIYQATGKAWQARVEPVDVHLATDGRVMEMLSEHTCQGYLLSDRHGLFNCYEAFIHIVDSMVNQHAKWLKISGMLPGRRPIPSLNYLLTSHVWRQDHNGFSHQDPGFIDHVVNKKAGVIRVYLPLDANTLLCVADHCLRSRDYVNVVVAGKNPEPVWLDIDAAAAHCARGIGIWEWAGNDSGDPDVVLATRVTCRPWRCWQPPTCCAAPAVVEGTGGQRGRPDAAAAGQRAPARAADAEFDAIFTTDRPVVFAYHGYPWLIHRRTNHANLHVRGYKEEGRTTTPFDMVVLNDMDRYHLFMDVIDRVPGLAPRAAVIRQSMVDARCGTGPTCASTARTCPRYATGSGRPDALAGSGALWSWCFAGPACPRAPDPPYGHPARR